MRRYFTTRRIGDVNFGMFLAPRRPAGQDPIGAKAARGVLGPSDRGRRAERGVAIDFQFDSTTDGKAIKIASMIDERETNFGPFVSVRDAPRIAGILRTFATGFLAEVAGLRADRQRDAAQPFCNDGDRAAGVLDLSPDEQRRRRIRQLAVPRPYPRRAEYVDHPGLVLEVEKRH